jgi:hypothetical protein
LLPQFVIEGDDQHAHVFRLLFYGGIHLPQARAELLSLDRRIVQARGHPAYRSVARDNL